MSRGMRNQRSIICRHCNHSFLTYKATAFCSSGCRHKYIAIHGTNKLEAYQDGASNTSNKTQ